MQNPVVVVKCDTFDQLVQKTAYCVLVQTTVADVQVFLQILVQVLEDQGKLLLGVDDVAQSNNIFMLQLLEQGDLPYRRARNPFIFRF